MLFLCSVSLLVKVIRLERHAGGLKVFCILNSLRSDRHLNICHDTIEDVILIFKGASS